MTRDFAISEATRRTEVLHTSHFVLKSKIEIDAYLVTTIAIATYEVIASFEFIAATA